MVVVEGFLRFLAWIWSLSKSAIHYLAKKASSVKIARSPGVGGVYLLMRLSYL
jgi:hypothetical protein